VAMEGEGERTKERKNTKGRGYVELATIALGEARRDVARVCPNTVRACPNKRRYTVRGGAMLLRRGEHSSHAAVVPGAEALVLRPVYWSPAACPRVPARMAHA
jgi:hypothetical protein